MEKQTRLDHLTKMHEMLTDYIKPFWDVVLVTDLQWVKDSLLVRAAAILLSSDEACLRRSR